MLHERETWPVGKENEVALQRAEMRKKNMTWRASDQEVDQRAVLCSNEVKVTHYCAKVTFVYFLLVTK